MGKLPCELTPDKLPLEEAIFLLESYKDFRLAENDYVVDNIGILLGSKIYVSDEDLKNEVPEKREKQTSFIFPLAYAFALSSINGKGYSDSVEKLKRQISDRNKGFISSSENANRLNRSEYKKKFCK